jgi:hypothetical protein
MVKKKLCDEEEESEATDQDGEEETVRWWRNRAVQNENDGES